MGRSRGGKDSVFTRAREAILRAMVYFLLAALAAAPMLAFGAPALTEAQERLQACYDMKAGGKIGMIYFGSQVAVYLPKDARILAAAGDKVYGAETILGHWAR